MERTGRKLLPAIWLAAIIFSPPAAAEIKKSLPYPYEWVFSAAVRLVKVDLRCEMVEENEKAGYVIFWYEYNGVKSYATMEIVDCSTDEAGYSVLVRVVLDKLPSWVELDLIEKLEAKIKDQYGSPPEQKKKKEKKKEGKEEEEDGKK